LGLYVRNVVGLTHSFVCHPGLIPGLVVVPRLLTNTARNPVWIDRRRVCHRATTKEP